MDGWTRLPYDVRLIILNMVFAQLTAPEENQAVGRPLKRMHCRMPSHGLVCRDWFEFFERETYRALFVTQDSLDRIGRLTRRQQRMVRYLWVKVDLVTYASPNDMDFYWEVCDLQYDANSTLINATIRRTFELLRSWDTEQGPGAPGLTLEISACSPSDMEHTFYNDLLFDTSPFDVDGPLERNRPSYSHPRNGWFQGKRTSPPSLHSILATLGFSFSHLDGLPAAPAVTSFIVRRQTRWQFGPLALANIIRRLPSLRRILIESWREFDCFSPGGWYPQDRNTVESLTMFEDFNEDYNAVARDLYPWPGETPFEIIRTPSAFVGKALAQSSQRLSSLTASYMVDARDFFSEAVKPGHFWDRLAVLSLTSRHLNGLSDDAVINEVLENAGRAALKMPALRRMDVWNGTKGNVCGFRYEVAGREASVEWHGNRLFSLSADAVRSWERAADWHTGGGGLIVKEPRIVRNKYIGSHATAMEILGLHNRVLHPVSFRQIACETSRYWFRQY
ncbi:hypothetical protein H634G_09622 [Metarhizium anisopliae BRIP 53293]|uniref:DUF6546 domain-containing protein n=1 Tax=Metarhizium anisopliae BRIP 53293 TaxID=1291518 RepID=A0A0D9NLM5_METAN|nr:hypothetical protein H634G_09622 [Metarhizium anisopliae BRIP 53293]KJK90325.1 hypothetical protein H633G_05798 [Metarhizium anisopliae BRIP 53284]